MIPVALLSNFLDYRKGENDSEVFLMDLFKHSIHVPVAFLLTFPKVEKENNM